MIEVLCRAPFDLGLCLRATRSFVTNELVAPESGGPETLRLGVWLADRPTLLEVRQRSEEPGVVAATASPEAPAEELHRLVARIVNADMELLPFYKAAAGHPVMEALTLQFRGLKPFRPASLFDMLVMAVTEQQISLTAAHHIQTRLVERFGSMVDGLPVFPRAQALAGAPLEALTGVGLSHRKAEYIEGMAAQVVSGALDLEAFETASADEVRTRVADIRGFGMWSANYLLIRGLGRPDVVPYDDLGVRRIVGRLLGDGRVLTAAETEQAFAPFAPFRGLATYYLLVASRGHAG